MSELLAGERRRQRLSRHHEINGTGPSFGPSAVGGSLRASRAGGLRRFLAPATTKAVATGHRREPLKTILAWPGTLGGQDRPASLGPGERAARTPLSVDGMVDGVS